MKGSGGWARAGVEGQVGWTACPHLDDTEAEVAPVEHDDLVLVGGVVQDVAQRQQRGRVAEDGAAPGGVALVRDDQPLLVGCDGVIQGGWLLVLIRGREVVLRGGPEGWGQGPLPQEGASPPPPRLPTPPRHTSSHLVKLEGHANPGRHHAVQQVHVSEDPLVPRGGDAEVPLEQGVQAV